MFRSLTEQETNLLEALGEGVFARHTWLSSVAYQKIHQMRLTRECNIPPRIGPANKKTLIPVDRFPKTTSHSSKLSATSIPQSQKTNFPLTNMSSLRSGQRLLQNSRLFRTQFRNPIARRYQTADATTAAPPPSQGLAARLWNSPVGVKTVHFW